MQRKIIVQKIRPMQVITQKDCIFSKVMIADYADAYLFELETTKPLKAMELQEKMWSKQPVFVKNLKQLRDRLVKPFGLQEGNPSVENLLITGEHREQKQSDGTMTDEMMIYKNDKHLQFFVSVKVIGNQNDIKQKVAVLTTVQYHNLFGRIYFAAIRPFHGMVVKMTMKSLLQNYCA